MLSSLLWGLEGYLGLLTYLASLKTAAEKIDNTPQLWSLYMNLYAQEDSPKSCLTPPWNSKCAVRIWSPIYRWAIFIISGMNKLLSTNINENGFEQRFLLRFKFTETRAEKDFILC